MICNVTLLFTQAVVTTYLVIMPSDLTQSDEKFLEELRKYPCLFDRSCRQYADMPKNNMAWKRISRSLDITITSQFSNQFNQSLQKSYLVNTNKNGFYELRFLRTSQFTNCIYGPLRCLFMLNTTDFTSFF